MSKLRSLAVAVLAVASITASLAASIVGTWHAHVDMSGMKLPAGANPQQMNQMKTMMNSMKISATFKADKTYSVTSVGGMSKKPTTQTGTWSQSGNTVTVKGKQQTQTMTVSGNGRTMTMIPAGGNGVKVIFTR